MDNFSLRDSEPQVSMLLDADYGDMVALGGYVALPEHFVPQADWASASHAGLVRVHNEDSCRIEPAAGLYVLADGMGGYNAGEVASAIAANYVVELLNQRRAQLGESGLDRVVELRKAILTANQKIIETATLRPECLGMGTTIIAAWYHNRLLTYAHVGDSRLYRWRDRKLQCLTKDHSVGQEMIDAGVVTGEQARTIAARGILTRALGADTDPEIDVSQTTVNIGDVYLLCSDGLTDMVDDNAIARILSAHLADGPEEVSHLLINEALARGGSDNVTITLVQPA
jgi:PPM family protein phosphatase